MMPIDDLHNAIDQEQLDDWVARFRFYRASPDRDDIIAWVKLFEKADQPLAGKVLDNTSLISEQEIMAAFKGALEKIGGWQRKKSLRQGRWFFAGFGKAGESGQTMLHKFREANNMAGNRFDEMFVSASDFPSLLLTNQDTVIFVDDFSGSGDQFSKLWPKMKELLSATPQVHLVLYAVTTLAFQAIQSADGIQMHAASILSADANIFDETNVKFTVAEKIKIENYCKKIDPRNPRGYNSGGLLIVLSHKTPNNSIPMLHHTTKNWKPLFPRYLQAHP